ncbi:hypothetical protein HG263_04945 [Pseudoalteromonas sp. JBTF-M23]|uniref:Uncharacterized protein n=1 Tax=Pseudoalteromonas caenipelagi TaxID=2726988 RepID=A0A849V976_9GAMM|nr:hypothetical protein [Pseudoalteromonas caenipelagi]NOU49882.1 hypothetical protein [Pseudoalteromonas caenipelagi]
MFKRIVATACVGLTVAYISTSFANSADKDIDIQKVSKDEYRILVFDHCQKMLEKPLNSEQVSSFLALEEQSELMRKLEKPIHAVSRQMSKLGREVEAISRKAFIEDDKTLTIDKTHLAEQKLLSKQLEALADAHKDDFNTLERQGKNVESAAKRFESTIKPLIADVENAHIQILEPGEVEKPCDPHIKQI